MAQMAPPEPNLPNFNRYEEDKMALGHTPSTRSAELVAGARDILLKSDETIALSKLSGRVVSRFLSDLDKKTNIMWFFPARMMAIEALTKRHFPEDKKDLLLVDIAAGFSPRGLHLAKQYPQAQVIEVDLPEVAAEKKKRLEKGKIAIPPNLSWIGTDLGKANLKEVLDGRKADLITSEGLTLYLTATENARLFRQASSALAPGGIFMAEVYFKDKLQRLRQNPNVNTVASFIFRLVGSVPGLMANMDAASQLMTEAGLDQIKEYPVTDMMEELGQPKPLDVISIVVAHKPATTEWLGIAPVEEKIAIPITPPTPLTTPAQPVTLTPPTPPEPKPAP
jgi:O-methyltransferase involved in polyketide biosynthesis